MNRDGMTLEKRVQMLEGAVDSIAPELHNMYDMLRDIKEIMRRHLFDEAHCNIEKAIEKRLKEYDKRWLWDGE